MTWQTLFLRVWEQAQMRQLTFFSNKILPFMKKKNQRKNHMNRTQYFSHMRQQPFFFFSFSFFCNILPFERGKKRDVYEQNLVFFPIQFHCRCMRQGLVVCDDIRFRGWVSSSGCKATSQRFPCTSRAGWEGSGHGFPLFFRTSTTAWGKLTHHVSKQLQVHVSLNVNHNFTLSPNSLKQGSAQSMKSLVQMHDFKSMKVNFLIMGIGKYINGQYPKRIST